MPTAVQNYIKRLEKSFNVGNATEHTYRPALKSFLEDLRHGLTATNEPRRESCGAPDFIVSQGSAPLGYVETKDIGASLDRIEDSDQLQRYRESLTNLILTNYTEFRWYVGGEHRLSATLGSVGRQGRLRWTADGSERLLQLLGGFFDATTPILASPRDLATRMAASARLIRDLIHRALSDEPAQGTLHEQLAGFREVLIHDLTEPQFADMYAQTICYGLFAARCSAPHASPFTREHAAFELPRTNPFLRRMFGHIAGPELDQRIVWAVDDLVALLSRANIKAILRDFGTRSRREDPVVHFYETFLAQYDPAMREARGVYYTPEPVVSFIVRSVDRVLRKEFAIKAGLADSSTLQPVTKRRATAKKASAKSAPVHRVIVLDPAVGTGTFLYSVVDLIRERMKGNEGMWSGYVSDHLLPRLYGFEYLMAPYAVAHMKLGLQLAESGYDFEADERLRIYLTNTLEEADDVGTAPLFTQWLAAEANAASRVKSDVPVMVVLGNPPYSGHSENKGDWITGLVEDYKQISGKKLKLGQGKWLQNDYVKFIRFGQYRVETTGYGILAMITDHSYVDSGTFVGMRANLQAAFDDLYILDLEGNAKRNRNRADVDENVFDITQGVAIIIAVKRTAAAQAKKQPGRVYTAQLRGTREDKYEFLSTHALENVPWELSPCRAPYYLFATSSESHLAEYETLPSVLDLFPGSYSRKQAKRVGTGFVTTHDSFAISHSRDEMEDKVTALLESEDEDSARELFRLCGQDQWSYTNAKNDLPDEEWRDGIREVTYRPFDTRFTVWNRHVCVHRRLDVNRHLVDGNHALCIGQAGNVVGDEQWTLAFVTDKPVDFNVFYRGGCAVLPVFLTEEEQKDDLFGSNGVKLTQSERKANVAPALVEAWAASLKMKYSPVGTSRDSKSFSATDVADYVYAILYSPGYRLRYAGMLDIDYPRIPQTSNARLFRALVELGASLRTVHLGNADLNVTVSYPEPGANLVEQILFEAGPGGVGRVMINDHQYFEGVTEATWRFRIGGYLVGEHWLKHRKGRALSYDDIAHFQYLVTAVDKTRELMTQVDDSIQEYGGWPLS